MPKGPTLQYPAIRFLPAQNQNAAQAPAYGLVRVVSIDPKGLYTVDQPNTDSQQVFGTNFVPIQASNAGPGAVTNDWPWWVLYDQANDGDPSVGDIMGAGAGSWKIRKNKTGFKVVGVDTARTLAKVVLQAGAGVSGLKVEYDDHSVVVNPCTDLQVKILDFVLANSGGGVALLGTRGLTGTYTAGPIVTNVTFDPVACNVTNTTKTLTVTLQDGLVQSWTFA